MNANTKNVIGNRGGGAKRPADVHKKKEWFTLLAGACTVCLLLWLGSLAAGGGDAVSGESDVRILRAMTSNSSTCLPVAGEYRDWVEFVNTSAEDVEL